MEIGHMVIFPSEIERVESKTKDYKYALPCGGENTYQFSQTKIYLKQTINKPVKRPYNVEIVGRIKLVGYLCEDGKTIIEY